MKNITVDEILNVIDNTSIELYNSEWNELREVFTKFLESKKGRERTESSNSWGGTHNRFKDEWGNSDWRDIGEMGG
jgi:hypothetical protein